jgi:hydrogenase-4 component F
MQLIVLLFVPLLASAAELIPWKSEESPGRLTVVVNAIQFFLAVWVGANILQGQTVVGLRDWITCNAFDAVMLLTITFVGLTSSIFSTGYIGTTTYKGTPGKVRRYYARFNLFLFSMIAVPIFSQVALVWIAVELSTLASVFLVAFDETPEALEAAWKYAILTSIGASFALLGVLMLYWGMRIAGGTDFTWTELYRVSAQMPIPLVRTAFVFLIVGFGTKAGLVPLHTWLPDAYSQAPSPVLALLSVVETCTAPYVIIKLLPLLSTPGLEAIRTWLIVFGLMSVGTAALLMFQVKEYKRLFAYSTIEHVGIIFVAAGFGGTLASYGLTFQILSHALTKSMCFFATGSALFLTQTTDIARIRGLSKVSPIAGGMLLAGGLAISGAPPFVVFLSELGIIKAGISSEQYVAAGLLVVFVVLAFAAIMRHINRMVFGIPLSSASATPLPRSLTVALVLSLVPVAIFGLFVPNPLFDLLRLAALSLGK